MLQHYTWLLNDVCFSTTGYCYSNCHPSVRTYHPSRDFLFTPQVELMCQQLSQLPEGGREHLGGEPPSCMAAGGARECAQLGLLAWPQSVQRRVQKNA